jgi:competence protein ComEC
MFLKKVMPEVAVVSVGAKNTYGHPNGDTLTRLDTVGAKIFRTDKMGTIEVVTDGKTYEVRHR